MNAKRLALTILAVLATVVFAALGVWQVERRTWKLDLIDRVEARVHAPAAPLPPRAQWPEINERDHGYLHVRVSGVWLRGCDTSVQAMTELGAGFWLVTPLLTQEGPVLVNRGFVPPEGREARNPPETQVAGPAAVTGLLRMTEPGGGFLRSNEPAAGRWHSRDVEAIARHCELAGAAPFFVDADAHAEAGGLPVGGLTVVQFRNSHLVYAITWFVLAAMSAFGVVLLLRAEPDR